MEVRVSANLPNCEFHFLLFLKRLRGKNIELRDSLRQVLVPDFLVPDFGVVVHTQQDDVMSKLCVRDEPFRNANPSLGIELNVFGLSVKDAEIVSNFGAV